MDFRMVSSFQPVCGQSTPVNFVMFSLIFCSSWDWSWNYTTAASELLTHWLWTRRTQNLKKKMKTPRVERYQILPHLQPFFIILNFILNNLWVPSYLTLSRQLQLVESSCADRWPVLREAGTEYQCRICPWLVIYLKTGTPQKFGFHWGLLAWLWLAQPAMMKHSVESFISDGQSELCLCKW